MYYNYGQSLRRTGQFAAAAEAALARREVWRGNGQRLFGVAVELAEIARLSDADASSGRNAKTSRRNHRDARRPRATPAGKIRFNWRMMNDLRFCGRMSSLSS